MRKSMFLFVLLFVFLSGCTTTQKAATVGGVGGATIGGIIGHQQGNGVKGAAIGAAVGTIGGMIVGDKMEKKFCPVCGRGFTEDVEYCPDDGTELKYKQQQIKKECLILIQKDLISIEARILASLYFVLVQIQ